MFKVIWDKEYNGVRLTMSSAGEALGTAPRPVFWEELDLLGLNKVGWIYPHVKEPLLWACDRRYFYKGEFVLEVKGGNIFDKPSVIQQEGYESLVLKPVDIEKLRSRNEDTMFIIEHEAMDFINQTYRRYKNIREVSKKNPDIDFQALANNLEKKTKEEHVVIKEDCDSFDVMPLSKAEELGKAPILNNHVELFICSFSGGKDSMVVLDLVTRVVPSDDLLVIYSDTGYELPSSMTLYDEIQKYYNALYPELKFYLAKNHQDVLLYWDKMGAPSRMHRWCCGVMKTAPLYRLLKQIYGTGKQPNVLAFEGVRAEESEQRSSYERVGVGVKHNNVLNVRPIFEWNATEIYLYLLFRDLPINDAYRNGLARVGCSLCPFSSDWSEFIVGRKYPNSINKFIDQLNSKMSILSITKESDKEFYIKSGNWKKRAGGKTANSDGSAVNFISASPDFKAEITNPKEDLITWLSPLGKCSIHTNSTTEIKGTLLFEGFTYDFEINYAKGSSGLTFIVTNTGDNIILTSLLKKCCYKATYCIHCEFCEVECPTGALSVVPTVKIDKDKCVHCRRCLTFKDKGCVTANSINISETTVNNNTRMATSGVDRYSTFGLRENWITDFFNNPDDFFKGGGQLGSKMIPACTNWFREAEILTEKDKRISNLGVLLQASFKDNPISVWEIIWINLTYNSLVVKFFSSNIDFEKSYSKEEIISIMEDEFPGINSNTLKNPLGALQNTFVASPIGDKLNVGIIVKENNKPVFSRRPYNDLSLVALAYSLYRYAERQQRYSLTVSEFYDENQKEGVYRQFGISKDTFERLLLSLQEESNHVLRAELRMGLDNIILRDDLNSIDILKMML
ncbi:MAG: phosphoadenosine phosphosulfate reductase family protein [Bacteroidales bacterium]|nr:phosphoadenosine phosphosulfate reductase family protein [Bacteroidales bacterium]